MGQVIWGDRLLEHLMDVFGSVRTSKTFARDHLTLQYEINYKVACNPYVGSHIATRQHV